MVIAHKYRIYPNRTQVEILYGQFHLCRWLHNTALEHRTTVYKAIGKSISYKDQQNELPSIKAAFPEFNRVHSQVLQDVLKRLDVSIPKKPVSSPVGIDLGLESFGVLSDGTTIENPRYLRNCEQRIKELPSAYAKHKSHTTTKRLSAWHQKVKNQRNDFLHKTSRLLVNRYGLIAYEDLNIKNRSQRCKPLPDEAGSFAPNGQSAKSGLNKSIYDAGGGKFIEMIRYKVESTGSYSIAVNPRNTSQRCSDCGTTVKKDMHQRQQVCPVGGLSLHRDHNASINILKSGTDVVFQIPLQLAAG